LHGGLGDGERLGEVAGEAEELRACEPELDDRAGAGDVGWLDLAQRLVAGELSAQVADRDVG